MCRASRERLQRQAGFFGQLNPVVLAALLIALLAVAVLLRQAV
ncbi:hypothetical protein GZL_05492 [Streptomyces sp. 769]|nr:hypothetical protein GZL_05492 [Streptomyces sp. 769]